MARYVLKCHARSTIHHHGMKIKSLFLVSALIGVYVAHTANAAVVFNESFDYTNGQLTTVSAPNWVNFNGSTLPIAVTGGTISLTNLASGPSGEDVRRSLGVAPITTGIIYYSALITPNSSAPTSANGDYFLSANVSATTGGGFLGRVFLSATSTGFTFGLSNGTSTPVDWTSDIALNSQYLVVVRLDVGTRTSTMGVFNPTAVPPSISDLDLTIGGGAASTTTAGVDFLALRQGSTTGAVFTNSIDSVIVATTLAEVIPEPSSLFLGSFGVLGILRRRR
jgi:PEP-CTERM motif